MSALGLHAASAGQRRAICLLAPSAPVHARCPMSDAPQGTLQTSLGTTYTPEHELAGGGMSRVLVAEETAFAADPRFAKKAGLLPPPPYFLEKR